jgi:hypothetical protein
MRRLVLALALFASPAFASEKEAPTCALSPAVTAKLVADAGELQAIGPHGDMLIGNLNYLREPEADAEAASGTVLFVKGATGWRAFIPSNWENEIEIFASADGKKLFVVAQRQIEGPGQSYTIVRTEDRFATAACAEVAFPADLNKPQWANETLEVRDLDVAANGRGRLVTYAKIEREGRPLRYWWYAYETRDAGKSWRGPVRVGGNARAPEGLYAPLKRTPADTLVADLKAFAKDK